MEPTKTEPGNGTEWRLNDVVIQLREWGTDRTYELPTATSGEWLVGAARTCEVRLNDERGFVSRRHARLSRDLVTWTITDNDSKNGLWLDNARRPSFVLAPGIEVGIGSLRLVAESDRVIALRAFLSRILGWSDERREQVDRALRAIREMATQRFPLQLNGEGDLVSVARALHQRALGDDKPFIVCDPRRLSMRSTPRSAENFADVRAAMHAAAEGTLCVWAHRLPANFDLARAELDRPGSRLRLVICNYALSDGQERVPVGAAITLTDLAQRSAEVDRVINEYAADAIISLGAKRSSFTSDDLAWTKRRRPQSLGEIETTVTRLVALREWGTVTRAAGHLGITHVALSRWLDRRER